MADNKKSFLLYCDLIHTVSKMPDEKAGELFKHVLNYVNDKNPITEDLIIQLTFEPIKQQLKRDLKKYEHKKIQWSEAGKRSAEVRNVNKNEQTLTDVEIRSTDSTVNDSVNDNVTVNVNDNVNVNDILLKKETKRIVFKIPSVAEIKKYCEERKNGIDAEYFFDFYTGKGWMIGKNKMKDWTACVRTWENSKKKTNISDEDDNR